MPKDSGSPWLQWSREEHGPVYRELTFIGTLSLFEEVVPVQSIKCHKVDRHLRRRGSPGVCVCDATPFDQNPQNAVRLIPSPLVLISLRNAL